MVNEALRNVLMADERIAYALLFGSVARGRSTPFSDVDIAIGLSPGASLTPQDIGGLIAALEQAAGRTVDLLIVDEAPPALAYRVFRDGSLLVERDRSARVTRTARAILEYLDFKPLEQVCARAVLRRAADG